MAKTSKEISEDIRHYFRMEGLSITKIAEMLGVTQSAVTNMLNGRRFGRNSARKYAETFGFNETYLLTGIGSLFGEEEKPEAAQRDIIPLPVETAKMFENMSETIRILVEMVSKDQAADAKKLLTPAQRLVRDYLKK